LPDFVLLDGPDPCPLAADEDVCNVLVHCGDDVVAVAGLAEQRLNVLDLAVGTSTNPVDGEVLAVATAGRLLAATGTRTVIIDRESGEVVWQPDSDDGETPPVIAFHPSEETFACGGRGAEVIDLYSVSTGMVTASLSGASPRLRWLGYGPNGRYLLALTPDTGAATVWRAGETEPHLPDVFGAMDYTSAAFHPDGEHCAMGMWSGSLGIHRLSDGAEVAERAAHNSGLNTLAFTPDGTLLLTGGDDGKLLAWEVLT
jgi:WD40 repeat protein